MAENYIATHITPWLLIFSCNRDMQAKSTLSHSLYTFGLKILRLSIPSLTHKQAENDADWSSLF